MPFTKYPLMSILFVLTLTLSLLGTVAAADAEPFRFTKAPSVVQNSNQAAPLAAVLSFQVSRPVSTLVKITDGQHSWKLSFDKAKKPSEGLPLIGFRPDREHTITVHATDESGEKLSSEKLVYRSSKLPEDPALFPKIVATTHLAENIEPGFRLLNPRRRVPQGAQLTDEQQLRFGESFGMLLMVDAEGTPVWYYHTDSRIAGFTYRETGSILFVTADFRLVEIDLLGNVIRSWVAGQRPQGPAQENGVAVDVLTFHHDADILPNGNVLALSTTKRSIEDYYTSEEDADAPRQTQQVMGDLAVEFTPDGKVLWQWDAFDHLPVERIGYETFSKYWIRRGFPGTIDWSHANSITKLDDGSIMVNFRYQSAIVNFNPQNGDINWIFGEPSGWPKELDAKRIRLQDSSRWPWHQHAPVFTSKGTLLLFDNGNYWARPFESPTEVKKTRSRAVEYEFDPKTKKARQIWTSETAGDRSVVSIAMGSASELPKTGNVLVGYGAVLDPEKIDEITWQTRSRFNQITRCVEYTRTSPAKVVWEFELEPTGSDPEIAWNLFNTQIVNLFAD